VKWIPSPAGDYSQKRIGILLVLELAEEPFGVVDEAERAAAADQPAGYGAEC
jgi:hypothetical protein